MAAELSQPEAVEKLFADVAARFDTLDVVVANAGINCVWSPISELTPEEWTTTISVNLTGTLLTVKYALPLLRAAGGGSIIVTASVNGTRIFDAASHIAGTEVWIDGAQSLLVG